MIWRVCKNILIFLQVACLISCLQSTAFSQTLGGLSNLPIDLQTQKMLALSIQTNAERAAKEMVRDHIGLELLTAGSTTNHISSVFGHSLIRFIDNDDDSLNDLIVGFEMLDIGDGKGLEKGLNGGNISVPTVMTMAEFLLRYGMNEGRSLDRTIIPTTPEITSRLKSVFLNIIRVPSLPGDYRFFSNNCMTILKKALGAAGYVLPVTLVDIPAQQSVYMNSILLTHVPTISLPAVSDLLWSKICQYWKSERGIRSCSVHINKWRLSNATISSWPLLLRTLQEKNFWYFLKKSSDYEKALIYQLWPYDLNEQSGSHGFLQIMNHLHELNLTSDKRVSLNHIFRKLPIEVYLHCRFDDHVCRENRKLAALKVWSREELLAFSKNFPLIEKYERDRIKQLVGAGRLSLEKWISSPIVQDVIHFRDNL